MTTTFPPRIYKIVPAALWAEAEAIGHFPGAPVDRADGYIHFSTAAQVRETAARHFRAHRDLLLVAVATAAVADRLRWEPSRGGDLFPHLYGRWATAEVVAVLPLPLDDGGVHVFPEPLP